MALFVFATTVTFCRYFPSFFSKRVIPVYHFNSFFSASNTFNSILLIWFAQRNPSFMDVKAKFFQNFSNIERHKASCDKYLYFNIIIKTFLKKVFIFKIFYINMRESPHSKCGEKIDFYENRYIKRV